MLKTFITENLKCPNCAAKIEKATSQLDGVKSAHLDFAKKSFDLELDEEKAQKVLPTIYAIAKRVEPNCILTEVNK